MAINLQARTRFIGGLILLVLGGWVLHSFLALLLWAVVLAVSTWPLYQRLVTAHDLNGKMTWVALGLTLLIATVILAPLGYGLSRLLQETEALAQLLSDIQERGMPPPAYLETLPIIGGWLKSSWLKLLGNADAANHFLQGLSTGTAITYTKAFAGQLLQRLFSFLTFLLVLLFVYQHGDKLGRQALNSSEKLFGEKGLRYAHHALLTVRATVNGMMLIGLGKGVLLGIAYGLAGLSNPAILGAITGIFALIPFAAKLIFGICSVVLLADGHVAAASGLFVYGMILTIIADNYVRPVLIGGAVKLPFIWTLLGIFGGVENFGLLGLFLGPTLMAVLMSIWRDWVEDMDKPQAPDNLPPAQP